VIYAVAAVHGKHKGDTVVFDWHYPDGSSFSYENTAVAPYKGNITAYAEMFPRGPGAYTVTTSINGNKLGSVDFTVVAKGKGNTPPGHGGSPPGQDNASAGQTSTPTGQ
jgi:hypothetical protein